MTMKLEKIETFVEMKEQNLLPLLMLLEEVSMWTVWLLRERQARRLQESHCSLKNLLLVVVVETFESLHLVQFALPKHLP